MAGNLARGNDLNIGQGKFLKIMTIAGIIFLLLPLIILIIFSFNESRTVTQWTGFSLKWYGKVLNDSSIWIAVRNSLVIAILSTIISTVLATLAAMLLGKYKFWGKQLFHNLMYVPVILPEIIFGVSLLALFMLIKFPLGIFSIVVAHITFSFPFATMIILAKVLNLPPSLEEASLDLGAGRWHTFRKVILPNIMPGVVSGALFAFTLSIDDFVVTFFTAGVGASTLPLKIYSLIKFGITPSVNAISTILIVFTIIILYASNVLQKSQRISKKFKTALAIFAAFIIGILVVSPFITSSGNQLNIYNYSDYLDEDLIKEFEKETGIKVNYDYFNDNEELLAKLEMGVEGYDLIFPTNYMVKIMRERNLIAPINFNAIPNYQYIDPMFRKLSYDTSGQYYIPYAYGYTAMVYNSDFIKEPVDSWKVLFNEKYKGRIMMLNDVREVFGVGYQLLGINVTTSTDDLMKVKDLMISQKPLVRRYESNALDVVMLSGDVWIAHAYNGAIAKLNRIDKKFKLGLPREGSLFWVDNMSIPANAPNRLNAEKFINFLLDPANSARNIIKIEHAMPNDSAVQLLDKEYQENQIIFPDLAKFKDLEMIEDMGDFNKHIEKAWTELKVK